MQKISPRTEITSDIAIDRWVRPQVRALSAYHVPNARGLLKLDALENPYPLPEKLCQQWSGQLQYIHINRYPDAAASDLKTEIRRVLQLEATAELLLGNGSDELIQMLAMLVGGHGRSIMAPVPTFSMYELIAHATNTEFVKLPLRADFSLDEAALLQGIAEHQPACVFLAYPNNPTGNHFDTAVIDKVLTHAPGLVVLDEAYYSFSRRSYVDQLARYPNLLVMRTLSKSGLAGLRLGMLLGSRQWLAQLEKIRLPYNINSLTQHTAKFCLQHYAVLQTQVEQIVASRDQLYQQLNAMPAVEAFPSAANFILLRVAEAKKVFAALLERGILIKNLDTPGSVLQNCLRVTVGTPAENQQFIQALGEVVK